MQPTYEPGDRIVYERVEGSEVRRGGDHIVCCANSGNAKERLTIDGKPLAGPYVRDGLVIDPMNRELDVKVPEGRLFLLGDHRLNAWDSRYFPDDHGGTLPVSAVRGRVVDDYSVPLVLGAAMILGAVLVLVGIGLGIAAAVVRRRARAAVPPPPPWMVRV